MRGSPARSRLSPTLSATSQASSWRRDVSESASPSKTFCMSLAMARGLVVSRSSPGVDSLRLGSSRSSRVTSSLSERANRVKPSGPPIACTIRFAAVLSLQSIAAAQASASVISPSATCVFETGAYSSRSPGPKAIFRSRRSWPSSTRFSAAAAARSLNVLHIGKRSSARWARIEPVPVSRTKTPSLPPALASITASRFVASLSRSPAEGAARAGSEAAPAARPTRNARRLECMGGLSNLSGARSTSRLRRPDGAASRAARVMDGGGGETSVGFAYPPEVAPRQARGHRGAAAMRKKRGCLRGPKNLFGKLSLRRGSLRSGCRPQPGDAEMQLFKLRQGAFVAGVCQARSFPAALLDGVDPDELARAPIQYVDGRNDHFDRPPADT